MLIIGLGYKKHSGKDTLAEMISEELNRHSIIIPHAIVHFADELKREVCKVCGIKETQLAKDKDTFRTILQWWGTEFRRKYGNNDNYWVEKMAARLDSIWSENKPVILIPDTRFTNECKWIKDRGGKLIHINRPGLQSIDTHPSEVELDNFTGWDMSVLNDGSKEQLLQKAKGIVNSLIIPNL
jgi:phosphomevalonate kinase